MEILYVKEFLKRQEPQFEWMHEFGVGKAITRLKDNQDFYLKDWNPISVDTIGHSGEFDFDVFEYSITKFYPDQIHVDVAINKVKIFVEINDLEKTIDKILSKLSPDQKQLLEEHREKNKPSYDITLFCLQEKIFKSWHK